MTGDARPLDLAVVLIAAALAGIPAAAGAGPDLLGELNAVRADGCSGRSGVAPALEASARLGDAASRAAANMPLRDALAASGYRATASAVIHVSGVSDAKSIAGFIAGRYCASLLESRYREIGIHQQSRDTWIILATPFAAPPAGAADAVAQRVLELVNGARMQARLCGNIRFAPAGLLTLNVVLNRASLAHAADMARYGYLAHVGRDGSSPAERVSRAGYRWRSVGENIASGPTTPEAVVDGWVRSPHHCANLMAPQYTEMGVAYSVNRASEAGIYWVQLFAAAR